MKLKFIDESEMNSRGRKKIYPWDSFFEELYKYPNQWAVFPHTMPSPSVAYVTARKYKDIEIRTSRVDGATQWTVYFRYVPSTTEDEVF